MVHEQKTRLGLANRVLAGRAIVMAVPAKSTLGLLSPQAGRRRGDRQPGAPPRSAQGLAPGLPVVYVTGGAQGARTASTTRAVRQARPGPIRPSTLRRRQNHRGLPHFS